MLKALFWDHYGDFQWSSVAAAIALIGAISSAKFSWLSYRNSVKAAEKQHQMEQKKIDADIISKSRMQWIDRTKSIISEYIGDAVFIPIETVSIIKKEKNRPVAVNEALYVMEMNQKIKELNASIVRLKKNYNLIQMDFTEIVDDKEHQEHIEVFQYVREIDELIYSISGIQGNSVNGVVSFYEKTDDDADQIMAKEDKIVEQVRLLTSKMNEYYKREWEKVKSGE